ncbi:hypothetical protein OHA70_38470 [Kribbella sp. NBC_00382]|uniref:hypothetical protein n=1 Tax=Kribbella sp. NBC_00382 TaxID=2975967 RepID=UPI002E1BCDCA
MFEGLGKGFMSFLLDKYLVNQEDLLASVSWRFAHGLLVVESSDSADPHEGWSPAVESVHAGADSLYVAVLPAASGFATLTCVSGSYQPPGLRAAFTGVLRFSDASMAITDPGGSLSLEVPAPGERCSVTLYSDHPDEPSELVLVVAEAA